MSEIIHTSGFFATSFPVNIDDSNKISIEKLPEGLGELSERFSFGFENTGIMIDGTIYTVKTDPEYFGKQITLGDIMDDGDVDEKYFIPEERLYYTYPEITHSDESQERLSKEKGRRGNILKVLKSFHEKRLMVMNIFFQKVQFR